MCARGESLGTRLKSVSFSIYFQLTEIDFVHFLTNSQTFGNTHFDIAPWHLVSIW